MRYPIEENIQYRLAAGKQGPSGAGKTINMGSAGLLFTADQPLPIGGKFEVSMNWPVLLDGVTPLKLVATGIVVRNVGQGAALRILNHEFRTRATRPALVQPIRP